MVNYVKKDDFTIQSTDTITVTKELTKDQINYKIQEIESNIVWFENKIAELETEKTEYEWLLQQAIDLWVLTRDEWQAQQPVEDPVIPE